MKLFLSSFVLFLILSQVSGQSLIKIPVKANKLTYDNTRNLLYATVSSQDSLYGNQLIAINAATGQIVKNIFIGSEPSTMALTSDHNHMFIGLSAATLVKKVDLTQFAIEYQINLGSHSFNGGYFPFDLATITNKNDIVIVSRTFPSISPATAGIVVYRNQQMLPLVAGLNYNSVPIEFDPKNGQIYGFNNQTSGNELSTYTMDTLQGLTYVSNTMFNLGYDFKYADNYLFSNSKIVVDVTNNPVYQIGSFLYNQSVWGWSFAVDDSAKTYYIADTDGYNSVNVASFNVSTFVKTNLVTFTNTIPNNNYEPIGMEAIGTSNYAIIVKDTYNSSFNNSAGSYILLKAQTTVGLNEEQLTRSNVLIYPNPFTDNLKIVLPNSLAENAVINLMVEDITGRVILNSRTNTKEFHSIDTKAFDSGSYFIKLENLETKEVVVKKIIKN